MKATVINAALEPKPWKWYIAHGCFFYADYAPNRFHRLMQRIFFGMRWEQVQ